MTQNSYLGIDFIIGSGIVERRENKTTEELRNDKKTVMQETYGALLKIWRNLGDGLIEIFFENCQFNSPER